MMEYCEKCGDNNGSQHKQQKRSVVNSSRVSKIRRGCLKAIGIYLGLSFYGFLLAILGWWLCTLLRGCEDTPAESKSMDTVKMVTTTVDNSIEMTLEE